MIIKLRDFYTVILFALIFLIYKLFLNELLHIALVVLSYLLFLKVLNENSPIHLMYSIGFSVFIFFPALLNNFYALINYDLYFATLFVSFFFLFLTDHIVYKHNYNWNRKYLISFYFFSFLVVLFSLLKFDVRYVLSLFVLFYILSMKPKQFIYNFNISLLFISSFFIYYFFGWNGFGRTVTFGFLIAAFVYFLYLHNVQPNKYLFCIVSVIGSTLLVARKELSFSTDLNSLLNDSAVAPYGLASTFINNYNENGFDFWGFLDQILFTLLIFIPRELWESKPNGFGYQYVVDNMDQYLIDVGHSIASTLIGDHIYYLGWFGLITSLLMVYFIAKICDFFYKAKFLNGSLVIIFSCNMMVLVWGGMTSFSARIIFPFLIIFPIMLLYFLLRKNIKHN